jgi:hypothetical protein
MNGSSSGTGAAIGTVVGILVVIVIVVGGIAACTGFDRPDAGKIGVVRNGGPFDDRSVREVLPPGAGTSWVGMFSKTHFYPSDAVQRYYTITADPGAAGDRPGVDVVKTQTGDGFLVGLEGTFFFTTAFNGSKEGEETVADFDNQFGVRTFPVPGSDHELHPWEGDKGWGAFLNSAVRPVIDNELRIAILGYRCEELISSCALVASQGTTQIKDNGQLNNVNLAAIQEKVEQGVTEQLNAAFGHPYFKAISFRLVRVQLEPEIQAAINTALSAFAQVTQAKAQVEQAEQQRIAAEKLASVYEQSPALAEIQMIREAKNLPNANIYIGVSPTVVTK